MALNATVPVYGHSGGAVLTVEWQQGRLAVAADRVSVRELIASVAGRTGIEVRGLAHLDGEVSIRFSDRGLREGLAALLDPFDYAMLDEPAAGSVEGHIVVIIVGRKSESDTASPPGPERRRALATPVSTAAAEPDAFQVVERLAEQGDVAALREAAHTGDPSLRALAMPRLARLDPDEARRAATNAARSGDATERVLALQVLGGLDNPEAAHVLGMALMDPEAAVRHAAVVGLIGQTRSPVVTRFLEQALEDDAESIRLLARELLVRRSAAGS